MPALDPKALPKGHPDLRPGVQPVDETMIYQYIIDSRELPDESARPFSKWADLMWYEYNEDPETGLTNHQVIDGMLAYWRGGM